MCWSIVPIPRNHKFATSQHEPWNGNGPIGQIYFVNVSKKDELVIHEQQNQFPRQTRTSPRRYLTPDWFAAPSITRWVWLFPPSVTANNVHATIPNIKIRQDNKMERIRCRLHQLYDARQKRLNADDNRPIVVRQARNNGATLCVGPSIISCIGAVSFTTKKCKRRMRTFETWIFFRTTWSDKIFQSDYSQLPIQGVSLQRMRYFYELPCYCCIWWIFRKIYAEW